LPDDLPALVPDDDNEQSDCEPKPTKLTGDPIQRSDRPEAVEFAVLNKIANSVEPNDWDRDQRKQEMWIINSPRHESIGIYCAPNEWDEAKQSGGQVKECGRATFLTQWGQAGHARRHLQIVEQTTPDHLEKMYIDLDYWRTITYQEHNNNQYLNEKLGVIRRVACGYISIIDAEIQLSYLKLLYYSQSDVFFIQHLNTAQLSRVHGITIGIPRTNDPIYKANRRLDSFLPTVLGDLQAGYCRRRGMDVARW
jgi:hypothetical protein